MCVSIKPALRIFYYCGKIASTIQNDSLEISVKGWYTKAVSLTKMLGNLTSPFYLIVPIFYI